MKHTKLPWFIDNPDAESHYDIWHGFCEEDRDCIAEYVFSKANAEFIVRACNSHYDMLEVCKRAWHDMVFVCTLDEQDNQEYTKRINKTKDELSKVIAKAEGK